jgi:hypothetical protein
MRGGGFSLVVAVVAVLTSVAGIARSDGPLTTDPSKMNCEWIGICPAGSSGTLATLRDFRISQGRSACIWTLDDIDLTYGGHDPTQLRQALQEAEANWTTKPRWVLICTDYDLQDPVPSNMVANWALYNPELGHWENYIRGHWPYMDLDDDGTPELAVGRVPASDATELQRYVAKVIQHDTDVVGHSGYDAAMFLEYDQAVAGRDGDWARALGDSLYTNWLLMPSKTIYRSSTIGSFSLRDSATAAWDRGPGICMAFGTTSNWLMLEGFWQVCQLYVPWDVSQLAATYRFPAVLGVSCGIAATDHPILTACEDDDGVQPIAEQLLLGRADAGASIIIGPTRNTYQYYDFLLGKHLLMRYNAQDFTWGEILKNAMASALVEDPSAFDHVYQYVLAGDPATMARAGGVTGAQEAAPSRWELRLPAPNPASGTTQLAYSVARAGHVKLGICDVAGRRIRTLVDREVPAGAYTVLWDLRDDHGVPVRPGAYFARMELGDGAATRRVLVIR